MSNGDVPKDDSESVRQWMQGHPAEATRLADLVKANQASALRNLTEAVQLFVHLCQTVMQSGKATEQQLAGYQCVRQCLTRITLRFHNDLAGCSADFNLDVTNETGGRKAMRCISEDGTRWELFVVVRGKEEK